MKYFIYSGCSVELSSDIALAISGNHKLLRLLVAILPDYIIQVFIIWKYELYFRNKHIYIFLCHKYYISHVLEGCYW